MAKIPRKQIFPFASGASNNGVFGSAQAGTKITTTDIEAIQGISGDAPSTAYIAGWLDAVVSGQNLPPLEEMQGLQYLFSTELSYLFQEGIPEYYNLTNYFQNSIVKKPGTYQLYGSLIDNNQGNTLPVAVSDSNWQYLGDLSTLGGFSSSLVNQGYQKLPSGFIIQWGSATYANGSAYTFPITFPNNCFVLSIMSVGSGNAIVTYSAISTSGFTAISNSPVGTPASHNGIYIALGN